MLNKLQKTALRGDLFRHLDGIAVAPTAYSLQQHGVLDYLLEKETVDLVELTEKFKANEGYLNVALRLLCSQGWLKTLDDAAGKITFSLSADSKLAFGLVHLYKDVVHLLKFSGDYHKRKFQKEPFIVLAKIFEKYRNNYGLETTGDEHRNRIQHQILKHIEGHLVGPTVVILGMGGMFHKYFMEASFQADEYHSDPESFTKILNFLTFLDWFKESEGNYQFTETGLFFAKRASAYGVTVSYMPTFRMMDDLLFGKADVLRATGESEAEIHVDRAMNVWGSGGAHAAYFKKIDEIIIELFNRPIENQPKGIVDMGCGNGAFLKHIFEVIDKRTKRGEMLEDYPLFLVGADYNKAALKATRATLIQADIWAKVIWGDIGRPDLLANDLAKNYNIDIKELLNVRTFLDHNRVWSDPISPTIGRESTSTGAFAHRGRRISNNLVEDNLLEHFKKWTPYVSKFGLLVIELHTVPSSLAAEHVGRTASTAYDATHGFSDQYIVEIPVFHKVAKEAGLEVDLNHFYKFPNSDLATVSINLLRGNI